MYVCMYVCMYVKRTIFTFLSLVVLILLFNSKINAYEHPGSIFDTVKREKILVIVGDNLYQDAVSKYAIWKQQLGFDVKIVNRRDDLTWTSQMIQDSVNVYRNSVNYVLFFGDVLTLPPVYDTIKVENEKTGKKEKVVDWGKYSHNKYLINSGFVERIPVGIIPISKEQEGNNRREKLEEAGIIVNKIISYEKIPSKKDRFYSYISVFNWLENGSCDWNWYTDILRTDDYLGTYPKSSKNFPISSHDNIIDVFESGYQTTTNLRKGGFIIDSIYWAINPTKLASIKSGSEDAYFPNGLKMNEDGTGAKWNDNSLTKIKNAWQAGNFLTLYYGHGFENGWGGFRDGWTVDDPYYNNSTDITTGEIDWSNHKGINYWDCDKDDLKFKEKMDTHYPVIISPCCLAGTFGYDDTDKESDKKSWAEYLLSYKNGGAVGFFGSVIENYASIEKKYNAYIAEHLIEYLNNPNEKGFVIGEKLLDVKKEYSTSQSQYNHYFGDPAMRMWVCQIGKTPWSDSLVIGQNRLNTNIELSKIVHPVWTHANNDFGVKVSMVKDGILLGTSTLNGNVVLHKKPLTPGRAITTLSAPERACDESFSFSFDEETSIANFLTLSSYLKNFTVYGKEKVSINDRAKIYAIDSVFGNVGGGEIIIGRSANTSHVISTKNITLRQSKIHGNVIANENIIKQDGTQYYGVLQANIDNSEELDFFVNKEEIPTGTVNYTVKSGEVGKLEYGEVYKNINLESNSTLELSNGIYYCENLNMSPDANIIYNSEDGAIIFVVKNNVNIHSRSTIKNDNEAIVNPSSFQMIVGGEKIYIAPATKICADIIAPNADINVDGGKNAELYCHIYGNRVTVHQYTILNGAKTFDKDVALDELSEDNINNEEFVAKGYEFGVGAQPYIDGENFRLSHSTPKNTTITVNIFKHNSSKLVAQGTFESSNWLTTGDEIPSTAGLEDGIYIIKMYDNGRLKAQQNFLKD